MIPFCFAFTGESGVQQELESAEILLILET
jgi:hypothetical protein